MLTTVRSGQLLQQQQQHPQEQQDQQHPQQQAQQQQEELQTHRSVSAQLTQDDSTQLYS